MKEIITIGLLTGAFGLLAYKAYDIYCKKRVDEKIFGAFADNVYNDFLNGEIGYKDFIKAAGPKLLSIAPSLRNMKFLTKSARQYRDVAVKILDEYG